VSTVQLNDCGEELTLPMPSSAIIWKLCVPSGKFAEVNCTGLLQIVKDAPSNEHLNSFIPVPLPSLPPVSLPVNEIVTEFYDVLPSLDSKFLFPSVAVFIEI